MVFLDKYLYYNEICLPLLVVWPRTERCRWRETHYTRRRKAYQHPVVRKSRVHPVYCHFHSTHRTTLTSLHFAHPATWQNAAPHAGQDSQNAINNHHPHRGWTTTRATATEFPPNPVEMGTGQRRETRHWKLTRSCATFNEETPRTPRNERDDLLSL